MTAPRTEPVRWAPQAGPQAALIQCPFREILFGGARGGGKTDGIVGRVGIRAQLYGKHYNAVIFRHELPQADDLIERAEEVWSPYGRLNRSTLSFRWKNGARTRFRPLQRIADAAKYQGQNLTDVVIEEAGNFPDPAPILRLYGTLRSAHGTPTSMLMTGNPGGPGQQWLKERFRIAGPESGMVPIVEELPDGREARRIYIPSRVRDNRILLQHDPDYVSNLYLVGSRELVKAWLDGDWNAIEGAFFDCWDNEWHAVPKFELPREGMRFRSMDWGSARPFSVGWWWVCPDTMEHPLTRQVIPRGAMVRYREWYGCVSGKPNTGLKLTAEEVARGISERTPADEEISYTVADPAMFAEDGGPSIAERIMVEGRYALTRADNARVSHGRGHMGGWDQMRARMMGDEDENPMILCFNTCRDSIRTIPALQHDPDHLEDLDTNAEDHAADEWRYACMSRPWVKNATPDYDPVAEAVKPLTLEQQLAEHDRNQQKRRRL